MGQEQWREEAENQKLFEIREGDGHLGKFLEWGKGNRVNTVKQATMISECRAIASWRGPNWKWLVDFCDLVEDYQLTVGAPVNSRIQFLDAIKFERAAAHEKSRFMGVLPGGAPKD